MVNLKKDIKTMEAREKFQRDKRRLFQDINRLRNKAERLFLLFETPDPYYKDHEQGESILEDEWRRTHQEKRESVQRFMDACDELAQKIEEIEAPDSLDEYRNSQKAERNSERALSAFSTTGVLYAEMSYVDFRKQRRRRDRQPGIKNLTQKATQISNYIHRYVFPLLRKVSASLVNLLSSLLTPKSWSIEGGIGSNMLFFQGNVNLSIEFGK